MANLLRIAAVLVAIVGAVHGQTTTVNGRPVASGALVFEENFDRLDHTIWQHEKTMSGGGNWEFQVYDNSRINSYVKNGTLYLFPTLTEDRYGAGFITSQTLDLNGGSPADECTNPAFYGCSRAGSGSNPVNPTMSARIRTVNSFSFKYGRVEVRAKMPTGDWLWPAIWLLPRHNQYGTWPASGEIDIVEARGNAKLMANGVNIGVEQVASTLHWGPYFPYNGYANTSWSRNASPGYNAAYHVYGVTWTPDSIEFFLDGTSLGKTTPPAGGFWQMGNFPANIKNPWQYGTKMAPFDEEFYLILNVAVGGTNGFFPDNAVNEGGAGKPWSNPSSTAFIDFWNGRGGWYPTWQAAGENAAMQVDYVRVWAI